MGIHAENELFHDLEPKIWWIKGGPGAQTGGWGLGQSGAPWRPGGECFAPLPPGLV